MVHTDLKKARVTPIYKNGEDSDINSASDYRPISVISHIAKILEKLVKNQLILFLEERHVISTDQSAYLKGHSTQTSLHCVLDDWYENMDEGEYTAACVFDISKCFDCINHSLLLSKLEKYGIRNTALKWFTSYLSGRTQAVTCRGKPSGFKELVHGVPQGSILGPFLFLLFINDISSYAANGCAINLFADDLLTYTSGKDLEEVRQRLQQCVNNICDWYKVNRLKANPTKSKLIVIGTKTLLENVNDDNFHITYNYIKIPLVNEITYLGIKITSDLTWSEHIKEHARKINYKLVQLKKLAKSGCPKSLLMTIYKTFIQSRIDYGISIWGCTTKENMYKIQRLQNRAARIITQNWDFTIRGLDIVRGLKIQNITERRDYFLTKLTFESIHGILPNYLCDRITMRFDIHGFNTRGVNNMNVHLPSRQGTIFEKSLLYAGGKLWNSLSKVVKDSTGKFSFKTNYKKYVLPHLLPVNE